MARVCTWIENQTCKSNFTFLNVETIVFWPKVTDFEFFESFWNVPCPIFFVFTNKLTFNVETFLLSRTQKKLIRHLVSFENFSFITFFLCPLNCCTSWLYGIPQHLLLKLQRVQNRAKSWIFVLDKHTDVRTFLQQVHCLTVDKRKNYKDCNLMLPFFHFQLHAFCLIKLLINKYGSSYNLLRDKFLLLEVLRTKNCSGDKWKAFQRSSAVLRNALPDCFKHEYSKWF